MKKQPDNESLLIVRGAQKNETSITNSSVQPMGRLSTSQSQDRKPSALETMPSLTKSQSSHSSFSFKKHNNNLRTYGISGKIPFIYSFSFIQLFDYF
jgi:hypothetical protein